MKISIVTPSLNQGRYLRDAMESVRMQAYPNVEHLVLDGGSKDETLGLLHSFDGKAEWQHVNWRSGPDGGQSDALNRGFEEATGDIVGWLNSDDRYRPGCFASVIEAFSQNPDADVIYGDLGIIGEDGTMLRIRHEIGFSPFILLYHRVSYIPTPSTFFRRRVFDEGNRLQSSLHFAMDYEFFLRLTKAGYAIAHIPHVLADFRLHPASKSTSGELAQAREKREIMLSFSPIGGLPGPPLLHRSILAAMQLVAGLVRYSRKLLRGSYFNRPMMRKRSSEGERGTV